uniref:Uncharacterized protein n=1 Tax=Setaria digitata TaxID=48799 RepID=A0A915Q0W6_9BILA
MSVSFVEKLLLAFVALNLAIVTLLYRFTTSEAPLTLIVQLMIPLIIWQIILGISFFPDEFIARFLDDFYGHDGAAGDQPLQEPPANVIDTIHSHGDIPRTPILGVVEEETSFDLLF